MQTDPQSAGRLQRFCRLQGRRGKKIESTPRPIPPTFWMQSPWIFAAIRSARRPRALNPTLASISVRSSPCQLRPTRRQFATSSTRSLEPGPAIDRNMAPKAPKFEIKYVFDPRCCALRRMADRALTGPPRAPETVRHPSNTVPVPLSNHSNPTRRVWRGHDPQGEDIQDYH